MFCLADFIEIPILESARRLGIGILSQTIGYAEVQARCPFCGDSKYHLSLNTHKNVFRCNRCKTFGNSITLYAKLMNVDNKTAYRELVGGNLYAIQPAPPPPKANSEQEPKPLTQRHDVYYDLLRLLTLKDEHKQNLLERGLTEERITRNMYRSVPMDDRYAEDVISLLSESYDLSGIPGFYTQAGTWKMYRRQGFFVPVCNEQGYIQGLQIRLDEEENRKYRWFSSRYEENGTRAYTWIHVTGQRAAAPNDACGRGTAIITEGALKADVASSLSKDALFVAVPGINCLSRLPEVLQSLGVTKVVEAFDMDKAHNPHVAQAVMEMERIVRELGLSYQPYNWSSSYKGIDEYLLSRMVG